MAKKNLDKEIDMDIVEAVETLSSIADLDFETDIGVTKKHKLVIQDQEVGYKTVHWMMEGDIPTTVRAVRDTFRTVLNYIRRFYRREYVEGGSQDLESLEGIKNIMVLVGEAAKKLDRYTGLFKQHKVGSVRKVREFQQLQNFYLNKIAQEGDERKDINKLFKERIVPISEKGVEKLRKKKKRDTGPKFTYVDMDAVKRDTDYELFYLRKDEGVRFFDERLLRNMKLVSDFGERFGHPTGEDALSKTPIWEDKGYHVTALNIMESAHTEIEAFYQIAMKFRERKLTSLLNQACMALMLAANPKNLLRQHPAKNCKKYLYDFQVYLREALLSPEYQRLLVYKSKRTAHVDEALISLSHALCRVMFTRVQGLREMDAVLQILLRTELNKKTKSKKLSSTLRNHEAAFRTVVARHPNGPINRILTSLERRRRSRQFDPLIQDNLPNQLFELHMNHSKCVHLRMPSPTIQSTVEKAGISPEFKGMIRSYGERKVKQCHLLLNLQDRTSWHGHARSEALEKLQSANPFSKELVVVTLPKDTDFYHQAPPYAKHSEAKTFLTQLQEHVGSEGSGFHFPKKIQAKILGSFLDELLEGIHSFFFEGRAELSRRERQDFIEILYLFLQVKIIDVVNPNTFSLTCKDAIDKGACASAQLYAFMCLVTDHAFSKEDLEFLDVTLFAPALLIRERSVSPDRFERMVSTVEAIESTKEKMGDKKFAEGLAKMSKGLFQQKLSTIRLGIPRKRAKG